MYDMGSVAQAELAGLATDGVALPASIAMAKTVAVMEAAREQLAALCAA